MEKEKTLEQLVQSTKEKAQTRSVFFLSVQELEELLSAIHLVRPTEGKSWITVGLGDSSFHCIYGGTILWQNEVETILANTLGVEELHGLLDQHVLPGTIIFISGSYPNRTNLYCLGLSGKARGAANRAGIYTVEELEKSAATSFAGLSGIGPKIAAELLDKLERHKKNILEEGNQG